MRIEKSSPTVFTPLDDGTGVLLNLETLIYYSLNPTGVALWKHIEAEKSITIDDLVRETCDRFDVSVETAQREIDAFVQHLQQFKIIRAGNPDSIG